MTEIPAARLTSFVESNREQLTGFLIRYYTPDRLEPKAPKDREGFTGGRFDFLGGGGDSETKNVITSDDLTAVECLGVRFPIRAKLMLLEGAVGTSLGKLLAQIEPGRDLHEYEVSPLLSSSASWKAWDVVHESLFDVGPVLTSKLLARKRPQLLPIFDDVIQCAFKLKAGAAGHWDWLHKILRANDLELAHLVEDIRSEASTKVGEIAYVSVLRVLDVMVWMSHHTNHFLPKKELTRSLRDARRIELCSAPLGWPE